MKKYTIILPIIIILAMLFSCFASIAQPTHIPHEDPAMAEDLPNPISLLYFYGDVYELAASELFVSAMSMLDELENANIPEDPRDLIEHYSMYPERLFTTMDYLELLQDEIVALIAGCPGCGTEQKIAETHVIINDAQIMLDDIIVATDALSDKLGVFTAVIGSPIRLAYERLVEAIQKVGHLIDELSYLNYSLANLYEIRMVGLLPVELSLEVTPISVFVGEDIIASGRLSSNGEPIADTKLTLLLDNEPVFVTTGLNGFYATNITVPYKYVSTMTLKAVYEPLGSDINIYPPCISQPVVINTSFYSTLLELVVPENGYPGLPFTISGQINSGGGIVERMVRVLLDDTQLAQETAQGQFNIQVILPTIVSSGRHSLTVVVVPQRRYAGVSESQSINISKIQIQAEIQRPLFIVIPKTVEVSGEVHFDQSPIAGARVKLRFRDYSTEVKTSTRGSFTTNIEVPIDLSLVGGQELEVTIEPFEPWYASLQISRQIITINPVITGLMLVIIVPLGLMVFKRSRTISLGRREEVVIPEKELRETLIIPPAPGPGYEYSSTRDRVLSAYRDGLEVVEKITGIPMAPNTTLREFLDTAARQLPVVVKPFTELTLTAESALYSNQKPGESTAVKAEQLAAIIKKELYSGAA